MPSSLLPQAPGSIHIHEGKIPIHIKIFLWGVYVDEPKQHSINKAGKALLGPSWSCRVLEAVSYSPVKGFSGFIDFLQWAKVW